MLLKDLTGDAALAATELETEITGLSADSRTVGEGYLFAALKGARSDGTDFIDAACDAGASAVLVSADTPYDVLDRPRPAVRSSSATTRDGRSPSWRRAFMPASLRNSSR